MRPCPVRTEVKLRLELDANCIPVGKIKHVLEMVNSINTAVGGLALACLRRDVGATRSAATPDDVRDLTRIVRSYA
jgi:hypothetical protein